MIYGLIAEYNPLHEGHRWQINYIKKNLGARALVVVLSGDFTQRGIPGVRPGYERAEWALEAGADLVIKLPVITSTGSAELFARGGVNLLKSLGIIDRLVFSAETPKTLLFEKTALALNLEDDSFKNELKENLKSGLSFPKARADALSKSLDNPDISEFLSRPNNTLGVEYIRAILDSKESLEYVPLQRQEGFLSSTKIRLNLSKSDYIHPEDFSLLIAKELVAREDFSEISDISEELSYRILKHKDEFRNPEDFALNVLKSKNYTYSKLLRVLFHILLEITDYDIQNIKDLNYAPYGQILGFKKETEYLISLLKEKSRIPVFTGHKEALSLLDKRAMKCYKKDLYASDIYRAVYNQKMGAGLTNVRSEAVRILK